jgi:Tfp pilus assembly PilM family ATPase
VTLLVGGADAYIRRFGMPRGPKLEALRQVPGHREFKMANLDPEHTAFDLDIVDVAGSGAQMQVIAVAAKKEAIRQRQRVAVEAGLSIAAVDAEAFALFNLFEHCLPDRVGQPVTLLHIGSDRSLIVVADEGAPLVARPFDSGVSGLVERLTTGGILPLDEAERTIAAGTNPDALHPAGFAEWIEQLAGEVQRTVASSRIPAGSDLAICGPGALVGGIAQHLEQLTGTRTQVFDPLEFLPRTPNVVVSRRNEGALYALALGAAIRQVT